MVYSSPLLVEDDYTLYKAETITGESLNGIFANITETAGEVQLAHRGGGNATRPGKGGTMPAKPEVDMPQADRPQGETPQIPDRGEMPEDMKYFTPPQGFADTEPPQEFKDNMPQWDTTPDENGKPIGFGGEGKFDFQNITQGNFSFGAATEPVFSMKAGANMFSGVAQLVTE